MIEMPSSPQENFSCSREINLCKLLDGKGKCLDNDQKAFSKNNSVLTAFM